MNFGNLCLGCMNPKGNHQECRTCGYVEGTPQVFPCLAPGTVLANRYLIGRHLRMTGEGVTYIALDHKTGRRVDIREYLPQSISTRRPGNDAVVVREKAGAVYKDYLADFIDVSKAVSRLGDSTAIVPLINIFESNNTAYAVYEHVEGKTLTELVRRAKRLTWEEAGPLFAPILGSLASAHALGLVHFGISPESIIMTHSGRLVLTDFGIPDARIAETELKSQIYDGFAALEQYSLDARKGKWTDVYSISAVMLFALTGKRPPDALARVRDPRLNVSSDLAEAIPTHVISAIANGLQVHSENRTSSLDELRSELYGSSVPRAAAAPVRREPQPAPPARDAEMRREAYPSAQSDAAPGFGAKFMGTVKDLGGRIGGYISDRRTRRADDQRSDKDDGSTPWYMNLSQWQYALLSTSLTIVVLGILAVIVFLSVRSDITGKDSGDRTLEIVYLQSDSDVSSDSGTMTTVPNLVGQTWGAELEGKYFDDIQILVLGKEFSDDYAEGVIMKQNISPDTEIRSGTPVGVTISKGSAMCTVPDIIGNTVGEAHSKLDAAGLMMGKQTEEYSDSYPAGTIIRLNNGASVGSRMQRDSAVDVVVSLGPEG
ncbi:MAG: PASTA domain-containing protein [Ruminococcaceae bacterium]|nr:PASTA domain-containing protein [Oscillospiraceae bacterium]